VSKETNRPLGHAEEADGIEEYDNPLPDWWLFLFWFTIVWALAYGIHYHFIGNRSQEKKLAAEMAAAAERWPAQQVSAATFEFTPDAIAAGGTIYAQNCVVCHGQDMTGGIGPSLLDAEWIHGGLATDVVRTITEGVTEKGMLAWGPILGPEKINQVAAYVLSKNAETLGLPLESYLVKQGEGEGEEEGEGEGEG
jgi:cytochrome c oxidase cbb3-type subunit 3